MDRTNLKGISMLVLSRKTTETIILSGGGLSSPITLVVLQCGGHQIRVGLSAPIDVRILRGELESRNDDETDCADDD